MTYSDISKLVSKQLGIPEDLIIHYTKHFWRFIKATLQEMPFKEGLTEELFSNLRTSFNIPEIGKIGCTYYNYKHLREKHGRLQKENACREFATSTEN